MVNVFQAVSLLLGLLAASEGVLEYQSHNAKHHGNIIFREFSESKNKRQAPQMNETTKDDHVYYTSVFHPPGAMANSLWFDISNLPDRENVNLSDPILSNNYRFFASHPLLFDFPYYGHTINSISVTTGGFLYASNYTHAELIALTHNIAPLQADFNPETNDTARIFIYSTSDRFTVQWNQVHNHDHVNDGPFTFQVSLFQDGSIHFVYREIPLAVSDINNENHPVEVGLSDSFYVDEPVPGGFIVRTVFEYSRIQLNATQQLQNSAYVLTPVLNCVVASSCDECIMLSTTSSFNCEWCPTAGRCSDGIDRYTQDWFESECSETAVTTCQVVSPLSAGAVAGISAAVVIVLAVVILGLGIIVIVFIAYKRPTSRMGLFLIEHRPKAMSLNKGSASYNVDSGNTILKEDLST
ncbi:plexin domain-containing protein 2-like [Halichondria panicea]|uniref:plexin domain-containing protein 2-like n=1 Tax=Halichondria panicea TaxID=6063 RepID=UPI00312B8DAE